MTVIDAPEHHVSCKCGTSTPAQQHGITRSERRRLLPTEIAELESESTESVLRDLGGRDNIGAIELGYSYNLVRVLKN